MHALVEGWLYILNSSCVGECFDILLLGLSGEQYKIVVFVLSGTHKCQTSRSGLTYVDRCMVLGLQLAEALMSWHEETFSSATHSSSKVISWRSLNVTQRPVAQQQPAPAIHVLHKEGWAEPNTQFPLFYKGAWIRKVVKNPIRRLSSAPGQS